MRGQTTAIIGALSGARSDRERNAKRRRAAKRMLSKKEFEIWEKDFNAQIDKEDAELLKITMMAAGVVLIIIILGLL